MRRCWPSARSAWIIITTFRRATCSAAVFVEQLKLAGRAGKPIVIHTREAWEDTLRLLREHWSGSGIMHCFSGGPAEARQALDLGFHLSFGGVLTFPKAEALREAARADAGGPPAGGDGRAVSGARPQARQTQRAGLHGGDGRGVWRKSAA